MTGAGTRGHYPDGTHVKVNNFIQYFLSPVKFTNISSQHHAQVLVTTGNFLPFLNFLPVVEVAILKQFDVLFPMSYATEYENRSGWDDN